MPSVATPLSGKPLPGPELTPHGNGTEVVAQHMPGDKTGLYGGSQDDASCDREQMISFLKTHDAEARAFVTALNTDASLKWSQGTSVSVDQIEAYIGELTPVYLRVDTRVTNFGFNDGKPVPLQAILQAGTAIMIDIYGVPRVRGPAGSPLTNPIAIDLRPLQRGTPWPDFNPGAIVIVQAARTVTIVFVLVDIYTGATFERMAGTIGADRMRTGPPPRQPDTPSATTATYDGTYVAENLPSKATVVVRNGRIVSFAEEAPGAGKCELAIEADFTIAPPTGEFSGSYTGTVSSGPHWCVATHGTMSGRVEGSQMTMTYTNANSGSSFDLQLKRT